MIFRRATKAVLAGAIATLCTTAVPAFAQDKKSAESPFPVPSPYKIAWEMKFEHGLPVRIVVDTGDKYPKAYWYMTYTVTNTDKQERTFLPVLELLTKDGAVVRSDNRVSPQVFKAIQQREKNQFLETQFAIGGMLRLGPDQAKDGVAIWEEPSTEMGTFSVFVSGLSGEYKILKDADGKEVTNTDGKPTILRKTLQLNYLIRGDEVYPGEDAINENAEEWVMR
jgi:hypothetical protein